MRFSGKTIIVTGGTSGIGFVTAQKVIAEGGSVIITGRNGQKLDKAVKALGPKAKGVVADSSRIESLKELAQTLRSDSTQIHGLFVNAGVPLLRGLMETTESDFENLMNVNLKGVFFTLQIIAPVLQEGSSIVLTGSVVGDKSSEGMMAYAASKAAVRSLARSASATFLKQKIRVNVISPGPIATPIWEVEGNAAPSEVREYIAEASPMKRFGQADEVANVAAMLLSSDSSYMTGANIFVDGGMGQL